jgi:4-amino-4-deoxy-L-arabinose transferase-like glycosyltransferase
MIGGDDLLELWGDNVSSVGQLLHVERATPIEIDPVVYPCLTFAEIRLFGVNPPVLRLPSLLGFLLMQVCLFYFVRRIASERAGGVALAFPAITGAFEYTMNIRPYGLLLGLFGLAMLSWSTAVRRDAHRTWALVVLALTIAGAINTHYFGVLLLVPLGAAELTRTWQSRRLDLPVLISMGAGTAGIVCFLPFLKGAAGFRDHYQAGAVPLRVIAQSYNLILLGHDVFSKYTNHLLAIGLGLLILLVLWGCLHQLRRKTLMLLDAELVFLVTLAALPFVGFVLGRYVTHAMEPRYALGSIIGIAALLSIALVPLLRYKLIGQVAFLLLCVVFVCKGIAGIYAEQRARQDGLSSLIVSPEIMAAVMASPSKLLYTQDIDLFGFAQFNEPDGDVRSHMALVYSMDQEMRWNHSATSSRIVLHLKSVQPHTILSYENVKTEPGEHIFVVDQGGWNWIEQAFAAEHVQVKPIGTAFGCEVVSVRFP